jgi:peptidoglycan/LPS O-acetylase OafA/YrhL
MRGPRERTGKLWAGGSAFIRVAVTANPWASGTPAVMAAIPRNLVFAYESPFPCPNLSAPSSTAGQVRGFGMQSGDSSSSNIVGTLSRSSIPNVCKQLLSRWLVPAKSEPRIGCKNKQDERSLVTKESFPDERRNNFDALRLIAAASVLFTHAYLVSVGNNDAEPFRQLLGAGIGVYGVAIFFVVSGYLITKSWFNTQNALNFAVKRFLRIYPGLAVCILLSALVVAPVFSNLDLVTYFTSLKYYDYVVENLMLRYYYAPTIPAVFFYEPSIEYSIGSLINVSLWTIRWEISCYLLVLLLGRLGVLNLWTSLAILIGSVVGFYLKLDGVCWPFVSLFLLPAFSAGMTIYFVHREMKLSGLVACLCILALIVLAYFGHTYMAFSIFGAYVLIYLAMSPLVYVGNAARYGDLSYGVYLYGWPIEQCLRYGLGDGVSWWNVFGLALPISFACGWLSWRLVERPTLRFRGILKNTDATTDYWAPRKIPLAKSPRI